jgi:prophage regulatory protein
MMNERLLKLSQVISIIPLSKCQIYILIKKKEFPKPLKIGRTSLWKLSEIEEYINILTQSR